MVTAIFAVVFFVVAVACWSMWALGEPCDDPSCRACNPHKEPR